MTDTTKLVQATIKYKEQRAKIKARQRRELEEELEPWKADVGDEISAVRRQGLSVADVCNAIGNQNRTFVYDMIGASARRNGTAKPEPVFEAYVTPDNDVVYEMDWYDNVVKVHFNEDDEHYTIPIIDGVPDLPEEWSDHTKERRALYKDIVKAINDHDWD
jgi:hypothetical protein